MLGKRLKDLRGKRTQQEIADKLDISRARYSHYETEHVQPDNEMLQKMAALHNVSVDHLLGRTDQKTKSAAAKLDEYLELDLTDDEIMNRITFKVGNMTLNEEEVKEFIRFVRFQKFTNAQADSSKSEGP